MDTDVAYAMLTAIVRQWIKDARHCHQDLHDLAIFLDTDQRDVERLLERTRHGKAHPLRQGL